MVTFSLISNSSVMHAEGGELFTVSLKKPLGLVLSGTYSRRYTCNLLRHLYPAVSITMQRHIVNNICICMENFLMTASLHWQSLAKIAISVQTRSFVHLNIVRLTLGSCMQSKIKRSSLKKLLKAALVKVQMSRLEIYSGVLQRDQRQDLSCAIRQHILSEPCQKDIQIIS